MMLASLLFSFQCRYLSALYFSTALSFLKVIYSEANIDFVDNICCIKFIHN